MTDIIEIKEKIEKLKFKEANENYQFIWNMAIIKAMECCDELEGDR